MNEDEIKQLIDDVNKMDELHGLDLSGRQLEWLIDLTEHAERGRFHRFTDNAISFLTTCKSGFYS
jgi:hypothetical protein